MAPDNVSAGFLIFYQMCPGDRFSSLGTIGSLALRTGACRVTASLFLSERTLARVHYSYRLQFQRLSLVASHVR